VFACWIGLLAAVFPALCVGADWPQWGGTDGKNMAADAEGLPVTFDAGEFKSGSREVDMATTRGLKWAVPLGMQTYGNPVVSGGKVIVGTNDAYLNDPRLKKTGGGVVLCLDERTGKLLWRLVVPRYNTGSHSFNYDDLRLGICASATIEGNRAYQLTSRGEVVCLDLDGLADGNDGPYTDEGQYMAGPGKPPVKLDAGVDADILWRYDMIAQLPVQPQDASSGAVLICGDLVYAGTSNGVDRSHKRVPYPDAPSLIALDKATGKLVAVDDEKIGRRLFHGQWSSPALATVGDRKLILYGAGDGVCYAFHPARRGPAGGVTKLRKAWATDCNPPEYKFKDGKAIPYKTKHYSFKSTVRGDGPSEIISTPVYHNGRVYVAVGQDPRHGRGMGALTCMDAATGRLVWRSKLVDRSLSTVSIADGLLYVADYSGNVHCFDAATGKRHWVHATGSPLWSSTFVADGKVYLGTDDRHFWVFQAGKEKKVLAKTPLREPMENTPLVANGVLYLATQRYLYALGPKAR